MSEVASKLGQLLERRIELRFKVHPLSIIEIINENTLVQAYGECCFGIDHFLRCGSKQVHIQEKWESHAPKLRDLRHFVVASNALQAKLPLLEQPLRIFLSKRRIDAPESLFVLQASNTESLADFTDIETAIESLYNRICLHFQLEVQQMTPELLQEAVTLESKFIEETKSVITHHLQPTITTDLQNFAQVTAPPLLNVMYGQQLGVDIINHIQGLASPLAIASGGTGQNSASAALAALNGVPTTRTVSGTGGLTGGGALSTNITIQIASDSNGYGTRYISSATPSGGSNGDIWYQT